MEREKQDKTKKKDDKQPQQQIVSSSHLNQSDTVQTIELSKINEAELSVDPKINSFANIAVDPIRQLCLAADKQVNEVYLHLEAFQTNHCFRNKSILCLLRLYAHILMVKLLH